METNDIFPINELPFDIFNEIMREIKLFCVFHLQRYYRTNRANFTLLLAIVQAKRKNNKNKYSKENKLYFEFWEAGNIDPNWEMRFLPETTNKTKSKYDPLRDKLTTVITFAKYDILEKLILHGRIHQDRLITSKRLDIIRECINTKLIKINREHITLAISMKDIEFLRWIVEKCNFIKQTSTKTLTKINSGWDLELAVTCDNVEIAKFVYSQCDKSELYENIWAQVNGKNSEMAEWLHTVIPLTNSDYVSDDFLTCVGLEWMLKYKIDIDPDDVSQRIFEKIERDPNDDDMLFHCKSALKWLQEHNMPIDSELYPRYMVQYKLLQSLNVRCAEDFLIRDDQFNYELDSSSLTAAFILRTLASGYDGTLSILSECLLNISTNEMDNEEIERCLDKIFDTRTLLNQIVANSSDNPTVRLWIQKKLSTMDV